MLESEIKEQLETQKKNIQFLKDTLKEIDALPEKEADKRADEYFSCLDILQNTNCLDDEVTKKRLLHEEKQLEEEISSKRYLDSDLYPSVIQQLVEAGYIHKMKNKSVYNIKVSNTKILTFLIQNYYINKQAVNTLMNRASFKKWIIGLYRAMDYSITEDSIKKTIDRIVRNELLKTI